MAVLSVGDILMLSQTAWKIGRAFAAGRKNAPPEFVEVEAEINALAKALKLLAETMFSDEHNLLAHADQDTKDGFATSLSSCKQTIQELDSLMDQYQVIKKTRTQGGFTVERSWSDLVVAKYQTMIWTADEGSIKDLRHLLKMHTTSMALTKQALQSNDISRLESVVSPMADKVDSIQRKAGKLGEQLDEATRIVQEIAYRPSHPSAPLERRPSQHVASQQAQTSGETFSAREFLPQRTSSRSHRHTNSSAQKVPDGRHSPVLSTVTASSLRSSIPSSTSATQKRTSFAEPSSTRSPASITSFDRDSNPSTESDSISRKNSPRGASIEGTKISKWHEVRSKPDSTVLSANVSPTIMDFSVHRVESHMSEPSIHPAIRDDITQLHRRATTLSQGKGFWDEAVRNSAVLCDVRGTAVEYAHKVSPELDSHGIEMVEACQDCRIAVVRKREASAHASDDVQIMTSIWVISHDSTLRMELKLADGGWYIPYSSYFCPEKVSVTVSCELKFHDVHYGQRVLKTERTNWINYIFVDSHAATAFQNELMGRTLLRTFRTSKTMRIHEGLSGTFSYAEQMCGMETLRIWEDNDTLAVIALIHFSPQFRIGYLAFYLNSSNAPIRVKDDGLKSIKIKGLRVQATEKGASTSRKNSTFEREGSFNGSSEGSLEGGVSVKSSLKGKGKKGEILEKKKIITGAKVEFDTESEKRQFLSLVWQVQGNMRDLPPLTGVN